MNLVAMHAGGGRLVREPRGGHAQPPAVRQELPEDALAEPLEKAVQVDGVDVVEALGLRQHAVLDAVVDEPCRQPVVAPPRIRQCPAARRHDALRVAALDAAIAGLQDLDAVLGRPGVEVVEVPFVADLVVGDVLAVTFGEAGIEILAALQVRGNAGQARPALPALYKRMRRFLADL